MVCSRRTFAAGLFLFTTILTFAADPKPGVFPDEKITVDKDEREYRLVVPKSVDLKKPAPLVFAFHGFLIDSKDAMPVYTGLNDTASKHKFILVYPNAIDRSWSLTPDKMVKDIAFFDALLTKLQEGYNIDDNRIYVTGMSNGGYMSHFIAKERSKVIAAAAPHSGALGLQTLLGINADRKFPVMIIHGDKDSIIKVDTARENRDKYQKEGHEVVYIELKDQQHWWGKDRGINDRIWSFFEEHPLDKKAEKK